MSDAATVKRPAEVQLIDQFKAERNTLLGGLDSRASVLKWGQSIAVRALGQIPQSRFARLAKSFRPDKEYDEGPLLASFLTKNARTRPIDDDVAKRVRQRWAAEVLGPVQTRAFRELRKDAGEYIGEGSDTDYDPADQDFVMRPALSDLDDFQSQALDVVLGGLKDRDSILDWGDQLSKATRGEPIDVERGPGAFISRVYREPSTVALLTREDEAYSRARQAFVAQWIIPAFNRGVRDLSGRTGEEPLEEDRDEREGRSL